MAKENGRAFQSLKAVLRKLSPSADEQLEPGPLTRISLTDARDMPTLKMPYGVDVPILHVSAGMRRIIALAYFWFGVGKSTSRQSNSKAWSLKQGLPS